MKTSNKRIAIAIAVRAGAARLKPRNPWVAAARLRKAGAHAASGKALRQQARRTLQRALAATDPD